MNYRNKAYTPFALYGIAALVMLVTLSLLCGTAVARFQKRSEYDLKLQSACESLHIYSSEDSFTFPEGWSAEDGAQNKKTLDFIISNASDKDSFCEYTQSAALKVFVTAGIGDPESLKLTLTADGKEYTASVSEVQPGTAAYFTYGEGFMYSFYTTGGEELSFALEGGKHSFKNLALTAFGSTEFPYLLRLVLTEKAV